MFWNILTTVVIFFLIGGEWGVTGEELAEGGESDLLLQDLAKMENPKRQHWSFGLRPGKRSSSYNPPPVFLPDLDKYYNWLKQMYQIEQELNENHVMRARDFHLIPKYSLQENEDSMAVDERQHWSIGLRPAGKRSQDAARYEEELHDKVSYILSQLLRTAQRN